MAAPGLTALKADWLAKVGVPQESWALHVPYGLESCSHVSLAYIHSEYAEAAADLIKGLTGTVVGRTIVVSEVVVVERSGKKTKIPLKGAAK